MGAAVIVVLGVFSAVVTFVWLAMDAGRYTWATALIGKTMDSLARRVRALRRGA